MSDILSPEPALAHVDDSLDPTLFAFNKPDGARLLSFVHPVRDGNRDVPIQLAQARVQVHELEALCAMWRSSPGGALRAGACQCERGECPCLWLVRSVAASAVLAGTPYLPPARDARPQESLPGL